MRLLRLRDKRDRERDVALVTALPAFAQQNGTPM